MSNALTFIKFDGDARYCVIANPYFQTYSLDRKNKIFSKDKYFARLCQSFETELLLGFDLLESKNDVGLDIS